MSSLNQYLDELLAQGRATFSKAEAVSVLGLSASAFSSAATRLIRQQRLISPKRGFYVILRPEDRVTGAPDPVRWIDPLMRFLGLDYRISLLRAAAFHGASHQAAMVFQVLVPKQISALVVGCHRLQFIYQAPDSFQKTNRPDWLDQLKSDAGYAQVAGIELTLLDSSRYFHKAGGFNGVAQIVYDLGAYARARQLGKAAQAYENSVVRRLGYLLDVYDHSPQASALLPMVMHAKSFKPLNPAINPVSKWLTCPVEKNEKWKLMINEFMEIEP